MNKIDELNLSDGNYAFCGTIVKLSYSKGSFTASGSQAANVPLLLCQNIRLRNRSEGL